MGVTSTTRFAIGVFSASGVTSVIGAPVALHIQNHFQEKGGGYAHNQTFSQISLRKCESQVQKNGETIDFGSTTSGTICGDFKTNTQTVGQPEEYTTLFQEQGRDKDRAWKNNTNNKNGSQQCLDRGNSSWVIMDPEDKKDGIQHLGLCGDSTTEKTLFVKKRKSPDTLPNKEKGTLLVCDSDCGENEAYSDGNSPKILKQEKQDSGKEIEFYKSLTKNN